MKQIELTTLTINDITEHHTFLERNQCIDLFLPADRRQEVADDMVERFIGTFMVLEGEVSGMITLEGVLVGIVIGMLIMIGLIWWVFKR